MVSSRDKGRVTMIISMEHMVRAMAHRLVPSSHTKVEWDGMKGYMKGFPEFQKVQFLPFSLSALDLYSLPPFAE
jgi:hypothetical protein